MVDLDRYKTQIKFLGIKESGQERLTQSKIVIVGLGGLGSFFLQYLVRAGIGKITIIDFDTIELSNLQRQILYDEWDVEEGRLKVEVALEKMSRVNRQVELSGFATYLSPQNAEKLLLNHDLILDATDNYPTRYLINDVALKHSIPWIFSAVAGAFGMASVIIPGKTPCLKEIVLEGVSSEALSCSTAGIISPIIASVAAFSTTQALKYLALGEEHIDKGLALIDLWHPTLEITDIKRDETNLCPTCHLGKYEYLEGTKFPIIKTHGSTC
ncbi:MAG: Molybdopterin-synthase adenylyltransferase [candidate division WS2 bacterium]|uniref:Molybdopterin-synthase adenylyltransferase n=1 Tax=Psychracetigena formicireducens TaxID=2986056 RepID=A0A9E2BFI9_PSYF1|nr:Molybdopterin-synthase adenylyltransferase [Candidatus Psychracetigena formicireducens]MBT9150553.1 Molybdopterin-synthase adenylyltransferase [Candidatus Psychracetigena formicireducens]